MNRMNWKGPEERQAGRPANLSLGQTPTHPTRGPDLLPGLYTYLGVLLNLEPSTYSRPDPPIPGPSTLGLPSTYPRPPIPHWTTST